MFKIISLAGSIMLFLFLALPSFLIGIGLIRQKKWADNLLLPLGFFYLLFFPLGTAIGIYGLVVFFTNPQSDHQFYQEKINTQANVHY
ncbi:hypothetical protein [Catalinimonas niigatensis]|uniref:hypothetical protein n=1 Tax=Catalinimonas niigatensis TaxID=1397264 RepID=UPI0026669651|nr:hypothetical protein [Catalinimonas niigatensis]WPP51535.1 hypothetical protein PZB72_03935 [Catalinimonas niigatensis]